MFARETRSGSPHWFRGTGSVELRLRLNHTNVPALRGVPTRRASQEHPSRLELQKLVVPPK
jgi:hypothetical protein